MKIRELVTLGVFLGLSGGIIVGARASCYRHDKEKEEKPKFYALRVVSETNVQNAKDSLGSPDGRYAEIQPGGKLLLLMEKELHPFPSLGGNQEGGGLPDSGSVVGKGGADFSLDGCLTTQDTQDKQHSAWVLLGVSSTGFYISTDVNKIRITNLGTKLLFVDAVIGYDREAERK